MKTAKYFIEVEYLENPMLAKMEISKKEFERQLAFMRQQIENTKDDECPIEEPDYSGRTQEGEGYTRTTYSFRSGCADTYLTELKAKEGYHFQTKKETRRTTS